MAGTVDEDGPRMTCAIARMDPAVIAERVRRIEEHFATRSPYLLADEARAAVGRDGDSELTYGVTPSRVTLALLRHVGVQAEDVYADLGAGVGHTVLLAACICRRAYGVELLRPLYDTAQQARAALGIRNAAFILGDLRKAPLDDATIVFSYLTCFGSELRAQIAERVARAQPGARVITVTHPLQHPRIEVLRSEDWEWSTDPDEDRREGREPNRHRVYFQQLR